MKHHYDEAITKLLSNIAQLVSHAPHDALPLCKRLLNIGKKRKDDYLSGYAYYYLDAAYFLSGDTRLAVANHPKKLQLLAASGQYERLVQSQNLFGLIAAARNDVSLALDSYLNALSLSIKHRLPYLSGRSHFRIGSLSMSLQEYQEALRSFRQAEKFYLRAPSHPHYHSNNLLQNASMAFCHLKQGSFKDAAELIRSMEAEEALAEDSSYLPALLCVKLRYLHMSGEPAVRDAILPALFDALTGCSMIFEFHTFLWDACELLYELGDDGCLLSFLSQIMEKLDFYQDSFPYLKLRILGYRISCYKRQGNEPMYQKALAEYQEQKEGHLKLSDEFSRSIIEYRFRMEELKAKQDAIYRRIQILKSKSERDPLTGLYNYSYISNHLEEAFDAALARKAWLGVILLDVDFFKEYNDTYGHPAGDEVLRQVAEVLRQVESGQICCARYGGDEFILVVLGMADNEVLSICRHIKQGLEEQNIPHASNPCSPCLSVSQGVRNCIPAPFNRPWDYLHAADMALYDVKRSHRSAIQLVPRYWPPESRQKFGAMQKKPG